MVKLNICNSLNDKNILSILHGGGIGVIPTDTQYGVVCLADNSQAVSKLYNLKNRNSKPGTIIASSAEQLVNLGIKPRYLKAVEDFWPNPISIVIPTGLQLNYLHQGMQTLALRIPNDKKLSEFMKKSGPLLTTSANAPGKQPASNIKEAISYFGNKVDFYVDGGDKSNQKPSTIIRIVDDAIEILRPGAVIIDEKGNIQ